MLARGTGCWVCFGVRPICAEGQPLNLWRIVVLSDAPDPRYAEAFEKQIAAGGLPGFLEIYLARDLGVTLRRR